MVTREDWESGSLPAAYDGDRGDWTVQSNTVDNGTYAAEVNAGFAASIISRDDITISPGSKLTLANWRNVSSGSQAPVGVVFGGPSTAGIGSWSGYTVGFNANGNIFINRYDSGSGTLLAQGSQGAAGTTWQDLVVEWESNGTITARVLDSNGSQIGSDTTATDATYSGGAWGFTGGLNGSVVGDLIVKDVVDLSWTDNASSEDGFRVYRTTTSSPSFPGDYTQIQEIATPDTQSYTDTDAPIGTTIHYAVTAYNADGESSPATGSVTVSGPAVDLVASGSTSGTGVGTVTRSRSTVATGSGVGAGSSVVVRSRTVTASGTSVGTGAASPQRARSMVGGGSGVGSGTAALTETVLISLAASGSGVGNGTALVAHVAALAATGTSVGTGDATATRSRSSVAGGSAVGSGTAVATRSRSFAGDGNAVATGAASMDRSRSIVATGNGIGSGTADLLEAVFVALAASGAATGTGSASMHRTRPIGAAGSSTGTGAAAVVRSRPLTADGGAVGVGVADPTRARSIIADGEATGAGTATVVHSFPLTATGRGDGSGTATLVISTSGGIHIIEVSGSWARVHTIDGSWSLRESVTGSWYRIKDVIGNL